MLLHMKPSHKKAASPDAATKTPPPASPAPHKLTLYTHAVQQPWLMVNWLVNTYTLFHQGRWPVVLREDFAGAAAIATAWAAHDPQHIAIAVERDRATHAFATRRARALAATNALDLDHLFMLHADVMAALPRTLPPARRVPRPDITTATNFSINYLHTRATLIAYLKKTRRELAPQGMFMLDTYQGPGAWRTSTQTNHISPSEESGVPPFDYHWRQVSVNHVTGIVKNAIDFTLHDGRTIKNAFTYHWRLWSIPELLDALADAGFHDPAVWHDSHDGFLEPVASIDDEENIVAYITASK